ncbi:hypothetical protein SGPA1_20317 [Streptomyces misionensis JCM 4497]
MSEVPRAHADVQPQRRPDRAVQRVPRHLPRLRRAGGPDPAGGPVVQADAAGPTRRPAVPGPVRARLGRPVRRPPLRARAPRAPRTPPPELHPHAVLQLGRQAEAPGHEVTGGFLKCGRYWD